MIITSTRTVKGLSSSPIPPPPPISMPVWSLACPIIQDSQTKTTSMNIMTFCTPVSITPKLWSLALYYDTLTQESLMASRHGILQLLTPAHASLVPILGTQSGRQVDKAALCQQAGYKWCSIMLTQTKPGSPNEITTTTTTTMEHEILPKCALYLQIEIQNNKDDTMMMMMMDAGDHVVVICQVLRTGTWNTNRGEVEWQTLDDDPLTPLDAPNVLYTGWLRQQGVL